MNSGDIQSLPVAIFIAMTFTVGGCLLGEAIRLQWLIRWTSFKPLWKWAFFMGLAVPMLNLLVYLFEVTSNVAPIKLMSSDNIMVVCGFGAVAYAVNWIFCVWCYKVIRKIYDNLPPRH